MAETRQNDRMELPRGWLPYSTVAAQVASDYRPTRTVVPSPVRNVPNLLALTQRQSSASLKTRKGGRP